MSKKHPLIIKSVLEELLDKIDTQIQNLSPTARSVKEYFLKKEEGVAKFPFEFITAPEDRTKAYELLMKKLSIHNIAVLPQDIRILNNFKETGYTGGQPLTAKQREQYLEQQSLPITPETTSEKLLGFWEKIKQLVGLEKNNQYQQVDSNNSLNESWVSWIGNKISWLVPAFLKSSQQSLKTPTDNLEHAPQHEAEYRNIKDNPEMLAEIIETGKEATQLGIKAASGKLQHIPKRQQSNEQKEV